MHAFIEKKYAFKLFMYLFFLSSCTCFSFASNTGAVFLYDCRASEMIPIHMYLVVHGGFLIAVIILRLVQSRREKDRKKDSNNKKSRKENCIELITTLIHIFLILWFFYDKYMYIQFD